MAKNNGNGSKAYLPAKQAVADKGDGGSPPKLQRLDSNPRGEFGPQYWHAFRESFAHIYALSLPDPSHEARFTISTRTYHTPSAILMRSEGTAFIMARGPAMVARRADQLLIYLELEGSCDNDWAGRRGRVEAGDIQIVDYARPFHSVTTDYANLIVILARESVPAALLSARAARTGLCARQQRGTARSAPLAIQEVYAQADDMTVSEAEAAIEGIVALMTAFARAKLAGDEADQVKSRRKATLDYIDAHLANAALGPDEIAAAAKLSVGVALPVAGGGRRYSRGVVEAPARRGAATHAGGPQRRALADGHRQGLRLWRHDPVQPGIPRALRRAAATIPHAGAPAGPRLARSAA